VGIDLADIDLQMLRAFGGLNTNEGSYRPSAVADAIDGVWFAVDDFTETDPAGDARVVDQANTVTATIAQVGHPQRGAEFATSSKRWTVRERIASSDPSLVQCRCIVEDI